MKSYFEILFQVEVFHNFFPVEEQHVCNSLSFIPSDECMRSLANNRLIFKKTVNGFAIVAEKKNIGTDALPNLVPFFSITPGTRFHFLISEPEDDFINITDADPDLFAEGRKYFFRNSPTQPAVVAGNHATIPLHNNTPLVNSLSLGPSNFIAPVAIASNPVKLVLKDIDGLFMVEKKVPRDSFNNISAERLLMSDESLPEGIYVLHQVNAANVSVLQKTYFLSGQSLKGKITGILDITYNSIMQGQENRHTHLTITLSPRNVHWIYNVDIEKYEDPGEFNTQRVLPVNLALDPSLSSPPVASPFTKTIVQALPLPADWHINDKVRFRSNNPIPLKKKPYSRIQLKNNGIAMPVIIDNMPNPDPLMIRKTAPNTYETEMFLKVK